MTKLPLPLQQFSSTVAPKSPAFPRRAQWLIAVAALGSMFAAYVLATAVQRLTDSSAMYLLTALAAALSGALLLFYLTRQITIKLAISVLTVLDVSYICTRLVYLALFRHEAHMLLYDLSSEFLWSVTTPMLAYTLPRNRVVDRFLWLQPIIFTITTILYVLLNYPSVGREVYSLSHLCALNWVVLLSSQGFSRTLRKLLRVRKDNVALSHLAYHDELTGLLNRRGMEVRFQELLETHRGTGKEIAVVFIDLDGFKAINDTMGHQVGDELLQSLARRIQRISEVWGEGARIAGDEFVVLAVINDPENLHQDGLRLHQALSRPVMVHGKQVNLTVSGGLSVFPRDGRGMHELLRRADLAMLSAKKNGKNSFQFYGPHLHDEGEDKQFIIRELMGVAERNELRLAFQPIWDVQVGKLHSCEALLRWRHPLLGDVSPEVFIPLAESSGSILPIGQWVLRNALQAVAEWHRLGYSGLRVAVNVSPLQLVQANFAELVRSELEQVGLSGEVLELEITEGLALTDRAATQTLLQELREMNITLSLDDFGEGFASLSHLRDLPVQLIKLDRSFLAGFSSDRPESLRYSRALIQASVQLSQTLDLKVVAEGLESAEQYSLLQELGCQYAQGYLLTPPLEGEAVLNYLEDAMRSAGTERPFSA